MPLNIKITLSTHNNYLELHQALSRQIHQASTIIGSRGAIQNTCVLLGLGLMRGRARDATKPTQSTSNTAAGDDLNLGLRGICSLGHSHQLVDGTRALLENLVRDGNRLLDVGHHS